MAPPAGDPWPHPGPGTRLQGLTMASPWPGPGRGRRPTGCARWRTAPRARRHASRTSQMALPLGCDVGPAAVAALCRITSLRPGRSQATCWGEDALLRLPMPRDDIPPDDAVAPWANHLRFAPWPLATHAETPRRLRRRLGFQRPVDSLRQGDRVALEVALRPGAASNLGGAIRDHMCRRAAQPRAGAIPELVQHLAVLARVRENHRPTDEPGVKPPRSASPWPKPPRGQRLWGGGRRCR